MMSRLGPRTPMIKGRDLSGEISERRRVSLAPGHSLMDWIKLGHAKGDLSGVGDKKLKVTPDELSKHNRANDLWMAIKGKVYNITPYNEFHPGGLDELMRAAGGDGTDLFDEIHSWVNVESMLSKCLVGSLIEDSSGPKASARRSISLSPSAPVPPIPIPTYDWYQTNALLKVVIYTKVPNLQKSSIVVDISLQEVVIETYAKDYTYFVHFKPHEPLKDTCEVKIANEKVELAFKKKNDKNWSSMGLPLKLNNIFVKSKHAEPRFWMWTVASNVAVNHDTRVIGLQCPNGTHMTVPIGYHFPLHKQISGMELARSYTVIISSLTQEKNYPEKGTDVPNKDNLIYLMIKNYSGGAISPLITAAKPGEKVKMSRFEGSFDKNILHNITQLVMFAAGTGITPMIRVIYYTLFQMEHATFQVNLVFYNRTVEDILWKDQFDKLSHASSRFSVTHVLSQPKPNSWNGMTGRVCKAHIQKFVSKPSQLDAKPLVLVCGPFAYSEAVEKYSKEQGLGSQHIFVFSHS